MMSHASATMRGLTAAFTVICTLGWVSDAEAVIQKRRWDPAYGVDLSGLGWSGEVDFNIADSCLDKVLVSKWISNLTYGCVNKLSISSATVTLYDIQDDNSNGLAPDVTLSYEGSTIPLGGDNSQLTLRMYVDVDKNTGEKNLLAVQGGFLLPEFVSSASAPFAVVANYDAAAYWLNFNDNKTNAPIFSKDVPTYGYAFLTSCSYRNGSSPEANQGFDGYKTAHKYDLDVTCSQNDGVSNPAVLVPVPEPESYMLALASFGVLGVWARRRRLNAR